MTAYDLPIVSHIGETDCSADSTFRLIITGYQDKDDPTPEEQNEEDEIYDNVVEHSNKEKSLLPLYIYQFLKHHSSPTKHVLQKDLIDALEKIHEIRYDRKTISKTVKALALSRYGIVYDATNPRAGCWYDEREDIGYTFRD